MHFHHPCVPGPMSSSGSFRVDGQQHWGFLGAAAPSTNSVRKCRTNCRQAHVGEAIGREDIRFTERLQRCGHLSRSQDNRQHIPPPTLLTTAPFAHFFFNKQTIHPTSPSNSWHFGVAGLGQNIFSINRPCKEGWTNR